MWIDWTRGRERSAECFATHEVPPETWSTARPPILHPTCTSCDCLTDLKDVTIFTFYYLLRVSIVDVLFLRAIRKLTIYSLSPFRKFTSVKAAGQGSVGQEGCHTVPPPLPPPPPSTKLDKPTGRTLCSCFPFSNIFSFLQTLGYCPFHVFANTPPKILTPNPSALYSLSSCFLSSGLCTISSGRLHRDCSYIMYSSTSLLQATLLVDSPSTTYRDFTWKSFFNKDLATQQWEPLLRSMWYLESLTKEGVTTHTGRVKTAVAMNWRSVTHIVKYTVCSQ